MELIKRVFAREIIDSRGNPTLEVEMETEHVIARAAVPSGASTGVHEALELRDKDEKRYKGKGVLQACENVNTIIRNELVHKDVQVLSQSALDALLIRLDGTPNKSKLGANAILGVSLAFAKAKAFVESIMLYRYFQGLMLDFHSPLNGARYVMPVPMVNVINGGLHADSGLDFQEFMLIPVGAPSFTEAMRWVSETFHTLKDLLHKMKLSTAVGDEGGFAPSIGNNEDALRMLCIAIEKAGYKPGEDIFLGLDVAASSFYDTAQERYILKSGQKEEQLTGTELKNLYNQLISKYPLISIEDPFAEDDWETFSAFKKDAGSQIQIVGDDLFVTNPARVARGIEQDAANAVLIKLNQIGTVSETLDAVTMSMKAGWTTIVSHRSGETEDTTIADLAVGWGTGQIKTGSMSRSERIAKYNQLLRIEEREAKNCIYPGKGAFYNLA